ncbi:MAG: DHH family phosphoesterase, partial [Acidobacteriota bacterium]|nr:DHH family phosphoesterase [Acidobacteriota bacterium]
MSEVATAGLPATWVRSEGSPPASDLTVEALGFAPHLSFFPALLARRGVTTLEEARAFLDPVIGDLHDPFLLDGMDAAVDRLLRARDGGERVVIVGDYDVDGVSATAILVAVFGACGIQSEPILPHRVHDGYGFQKVQVERAAELGAGVIVTADCGSTSIEAASEALARGIDVVVTDHHLPDRPHDRRVIEINPHQESSGYPFRHLSGSGLAFKLASALASRAGRPVAPELLLRVSCLGTIADMVPLEGENRVIARVGLEALASTKAPGLTSLMDVAGVRLPLDASDVGFRLGPRINAAGRMDSAHVALDLLLERDFTRAAEIAAQLDAWNAERRQAELKVVEEAQTWVEDLPELPAILVAASTEWHRGVVGIAAGRIARRYHRPTILLAEEGGLATGSGRSVEGIHLHGFLADWRDRLDRFGGHAQAI